MKIEFRAWDEQIKEFRSPGTISISSNGNPFVLSGTSSNLNDMRVEHLEDIVIEQFTGLTDINEKEIYEGDILSDFTMTDEGYAKSYLQVFWNEETGGWCLDLSYNQDKSEFTYLHFELYNYEYHISGNIREDAHLLKASAENKAITDNSAKETT